MVRVPEPVLNTAPSPVCLPPVISPPVICTVTALVTYSVLAAPITMFVENVRPPAVTAMRESAPMVVMPRSVVALEVVLRRAPHAELVPVPYRYRGTGRRDTPPCWMSSVAFVPTFMLPEPIALVLSASWIVPFSTQMPPLKVLSLVSTTKLSCLTAMPPEPDTTPPIESVFWFAP